MRRKMPRWDREKTAHQPQTTHVCFSPRFPESSRGTPHRRRLARPAPSPVGGLRLPSGFRGRHVTSMKRGGGAAGVGFGTPRCGPRGGNEAGWEPRGRADSGTGRTAAGTGVGKPGGAQKLLERGEREA